MSTTVIIGYANGEPLETEASVDLLVNGQLVATASPDVNGQVVFNADIPQPGVGAVRLSPS